MKQMSARASGSGDSSGAVFSVQEAPGRGRWVQTGRGEEHGRDTCRLFWAWGFQYSFFGSSGVGKGAIGMDEKGWRA